MLPYPNLRRISSAAAPVPKPRPNIPKLAVLATLELGTRLSRLRFIISVSCDDRVILKSFGSVGRYASCFFGRGCFDVLSKSTEGGILDRNAFGYNEIFMHTLQAFVAPLG